MLERLTQRSNSLSPETQVLLTLRYLGKGGYLSEIGDLHGVSEASVSRAFHDTVRAFNSHLKNISFPWTREEQERIKLGFCSIGGFPKVLGAVDGTLIPIKRPPANEEMAFVCRKGYHAINVQGVCDSDLRFTNVVVRWPGSTHDSLILKNSGLGKKMETGVVDGWLLGDSG
ncbi:putative nuclease HARBI1 [Haliotis rubra]|uniref:putative nuclease HARBI1 n=1 Tax=Haliotis rubra TaxID=36100 RepID=UPI001EE5C2AA|nr:putative nuclease HARBI1 [Haliotis rubra]